MGNRYPRPELHHDPQWQGPVPSAADEVLAATGYLGAIILIPVVPLVVYLAGRRRPGFVRGHAAQALNVALTVLLYAVSGTIMGLLLSFDSPVAALTVMLPLATAGWLIMVIQLVGGAIDAGRGEFRPLPHWICSPFVR